MSTVTNKENALEKAICQKADAQFQIAKWEWGQSPISKERLIKREKNISDGSGRGQVFGKAIDNEVEYNFLPLIYQLIQIELDLRITNHAPFTEERITDLRAYLRDFTKERWYYIVLEAYEESVAYVLHNQPLIMDYQEDEIRKMRDENLKIEPKGLFKIIDTKLQEAFAESVIHSERQKSTPTQSQLEVANLPIQEIIMGNKYSFGNITGSNVNVDSVLNQVAQTIGAASNVDDVGKKQLAELIEQLKAELQKTPPEMKDDADALAKTAKALIEAGTEAQPNKSMVQITADGLKKAAKNMASVVPPVLTIATSIVKTVFQIAGVPLP